MKKQRHTGHSKIEQLGAKELVHKLFQANATAEEIIQAVKQQTGAVVSDSAISRARGKWSRLQFRIEEIERETEAMDKLLGPGDGSRVRTVMDRVFWNKLMEAMAEAEVALDKADLVELSNLFLRAKRADLEAAKVQATAVDRPALYIECLKEFTDYLTRQAPEALKALEESFDGFLDDVKRKHATPVPATA